MASRGQAEEGRGRARGEARGHDARRHLGARAIQILDLSRQHSPLLVGTPDLRELRDLGGLLGGLAPATRVASFPDWDCLPYDHVSPSLGIMGERAGTLRWLATAGSPPDILLATVPALCQRVPPPEIWAGAHVEVRPSEPFDPDALTRRLEQLGYLAEERVDEPGQFAVHGHTLDVFPAAAARPCRIEHEDGRVTEIRSYDLESQRSLVATDLLIIDPASEIVTGGDVHDRPRPFSGEEHRLARFYPRLVTLFDYLPAARLLMGNGGDRRADLLFEQVAEGRQIAGGGEGGSGGLYLDPDEWARLVAARRLEAGEAGEIETVDLPGFRQRRQPRAALSRFVTERRRAGDRVLLMADKAGLRRLARAVGGARGDRPRAVADWAEASEGRPGEVLSLATALVAGFRMPDRKVTILAAADLPGAPVASDSNRSTPFASIGTELEVGDVAVDVENGLCVFEGLESVVSDEGQEEALRLRFAGDDVLMLPVEQADRVWRYGSEPGAVTLDRLEGGTWIKRRDEVKAGIARTARAMVRLARDRAAAEAERIVPDRPALERFASGFPFNLTANQAAAVDAVLTDLAAGRPMDRLVCGDVGFGKTEVALRAVAAAVFAGRQAVVVAPTTVLVRQHVETFRRRFARFGIEVAQLSRLVPPKEARRVKAGLSDGSIRIVIGTQALAGQEVAFSDLALTVIDEEQRFGTRMKARLRMLGRAGDGTRAGHVLTLTATPIPRTLQGALSGLQSLSLLATPPVSRQPIRTMVAPFEARMVGDALRRERARGGQSFVVCPRIEDLDSVGAQLASSAPELAVSVAHGGMKPAEMDEHMVRFADGTGDVLLATSIIESGLDVPRANTMIVCHADRFGLAELHQLRGRVGRGRRRGIVYLTTDPGSTLAGPAEKRLETVRKLDRLGAGFSIAARDLDLRGAGDLVGEEQAGHVQRIGLGLYQHLLELALQAAKGRPGEDWMPEVAVGMRGTVPADFVPDAETRLSLYTRLLRTRSPEEVEAWRDEVDDRFGTVPDAVQDLLTVAGLRVACRRLGVARLTAGPKGVAADLRRPVRLAGKEQPVRRIVSAGGSQEPGERARLAATFLRRLARSRSASGRGGEAGRGAASS